MYNIEVIYQDDNFAIINKPSMLSLFSDRAHSVSLWDLLKEYFKGKAIYQVHRLDKGTSGVLLIAFSKNVQAQLNRQFLQRTTEKYYLAICVGEPSPSNGCIDLPLCPGRKSRFRVAGQRDSIFLNQKLDTATWMLPPSVDSVTPDRKFYPSQTLFHTIFSDGQYSLLMLKPITGRTHQIRVHLAWIGHQLLGDTLYGRPSSSIQQADRLALHSFRLQLTENWLAGVAPQKRVFQAPIPDFFTDFMCGRVQQRADAALDLQSTLDLQSALDMALSSLERAQG